MAERTTKLLAWAGINADGKRERVEVKTAVRPLGVTGAGAPAPAADKGHHGHKH